MAWGKWKTKGGKIVGTQFIENRVWKSIMLSPCHVENFLLLRNDFLGFSPIHRPY